MEIAVVQAGQGLTHLKLSGRMDVDGVQREGSRFSDLVAGAGGDAIVEMTMVGFLASIGMRLLLENSRSLARRGGRMVLLGPSGMVAESLRIARIGDIIPIVSNLDEAKAHLRR